MRCRRVSSAGGASSDSTVSGGGGRVFCITMSERCFAPPEWSKAVGVTTLVRLARAPKTMAGCPGSGLVWTPPDGTGC
eukprot:scaffold88437_cov84-Phaeocystis_antarctica.AAC.2